MEEKLNDIPAIPLNIHEVSAYRLPKRSTTGDFDCPIKKLKKHCAMLLHEAGRQLEIKSFELDQTNAALKVLVDTRIIDNKKLETRILLNLKQSIEPILKGLKKTPLDDLQKRYLDLLDVAISNITLPLLGSLEAIDPSLTPAEIKVATLIRFGMTTKEIAETVNLSLRTVESHSRNIRRTLGIKNRKMKLRSYLLEEAQ